MFKLTIDDVMIAHKNVAVSGICENKSDFTSKLIDDEGTEYLAALPFIKYIILPDNNYITIELKDIKDPNNLKGRVLRSTKH